MVCFVSFCMSLNAKLSLLCVLKVTDRFRIAMEERPYRSAVNGCGTT